MNLPTHYLDKNEWIVLGPMGPELPQDFLHLPLIGVDGGANFCRTMDIWIGDSDSYKGIVEAQHIFQLPENKNHSDLALALALLKGSNPYILHLWGFHGGRVDHFLFNMGEALSFLSQHPGSEIKLYERGLKPNFLLLSAGEWHFSHIGLFSVGALVPTIIELNGQCRYQINSGQELSPLSSLGLSNVAQGIITLRTTGPVFIHFPELT
jgi:hypothetical protein